MWANFQTLLAFGIIAGLVLSSQGQVDIHEKSQDGYIRVKHDETAGTKEIYTSMHQLMQFFEEEKAYIEDIKALIDKKLVSQSAVSGISHIIMIINITTITKN